MTLRPNTLLLLPSLAAKRAVDGSFMLTRKFVEGVMQYVQHWPGPVCVCVDEAHSDDGNMDPVAVRPDHEAFSVMWRPGSSAAIRKLIGEAGLVLASLVEKNVQVADVGREVETPVVYISEYSLRTRKQIIRAETGNPLLRIRRSMYASRQERRFEAAVRRAAGVQCNGTPTYDAYRPLNPGCLLYFDTRVPAWMAIDDTSLDRRLNGMLTGGPLRLAFSGRLAAMKGADHLPRLAAELRDRGVPFTFDICGAGVQADEIHQSIRDLNLQSLVRMRGVLDFATELMPFVSREVDLFVCCHRQGDPSCTYLETLSCGVPIAGYNNESMAGLCTLAKVGWATPMDNIGALADCIAALHKHRQEIARQSREAAAFARRHTFEETMQRRVDHMHECGRTLEVVRA